MNSVSLDKSKKNVIRAVFKLKAPGTDILVDLENSVTIPAEKPKKVEKTPEALKQEILDMQITDTNISELKNKIDLYL